MKLECNQTQMLRNVIVYVTWLFELCKHVPECNHIPQNKKPTHAPQTNFRGAVSCSLNKW